MLDFSKIAVIAKYKKNYFSLELVYFEIFSVICVACIASIQASSGKAHKCTADS